MKIEYAGPRPMISQHGIDFKDGKEDKYVYLMISIQILQAIDKNYEEHKSYSYDTKTKRFSNDEIHQILNSYSTTLEQDVEDAEKSYTQKIDEEIEHIKMRTNLKESEKNAWVNNLEIMRNYRIQRSINKIYYMQSIELIKEIIKREEIKEIDTPFYEKYWHVLQTIQGALEEGRRSVHTELKIERSNENMIAKLIIGY
ncbi:hypothetical protein ALC152_18790 [Arcobacter sp. 15-2]|uniref:hypothetical protein n=1 Tax=Arcobacter sp. 15-2 TaxID=3374109 RepID=UPI00399CB184